MREANIKVPRFFNDGQPVPIPTIEMIETTLLNYFGGFTRSEVTGVWRDSGKVYHDLLYSYDIAMDSPGAELLLALAATVKLVCRQEAVYVRLFDGQVTFV